jgi:V-type H+-transporting ATPase subunit H
MTTPLLYAEEPPVVYDTIPTSEHILRTKEIPWDIYMTARLISDHDLQLLRRYDKRDPEQRAKMLAEAGPSYVSALLSVLRNVTKDETVQYVLALIEDMLENDSANAELFHMLPPVSPVGSPGSARQSSLIALDPYSILLRLLQRNDWFTEEKSAQILVTVLSSRPDKSELGKSFAEGGGLREPVARTITTFLEWLLSQLRRPSHPSRATPTVVHCLAVLLREPPVRQLFHRSNGVTLLSPLLSPPPLGATSMSIQLQYESILCAWELSFYGPAAEALAGMEGVVAGLIHVVRLAQKEKLVRAALLTLKNLLNVNDNAALDYAVVEKGLGKAVSIRQEQNWDDDDVPALLDWMAGHLEERVIALSSLERYKKEVLGGTLRRSPLHDSDAFWLENAEKLIENNSALLRMLVRLLENSREPTTLSLACRDLGQFVTFHPHGRGILVDLGAKGLVMRLLAHPDGEVQKEALVCLQRLLLSKDKMEFLAQA